MIRTGRPHARWMGAVAIATVVAAGNTVATAAETTDTTLAARVERLRDAYEIENVMSAYQHYQFGHAFDKVTALFALDDPDVREELAPAGAWIGGKKVAAFFATQDRAVKQHQRAGEMHEHVMDTPVIEIATDGLTARAMFDSPGTETDQTKGSWGWIKYGVDLKKEGDTWKILHNTVYGVTFNPYEQSWSRFGGFPPMPEMTEEQKAALAASGSSGSAGPPVDRPALVRWVYDGKGYPPPNPIPPQPYAKWPPAQTY